MKLKELFGCSPSPSSKKHKSNTSSRKEKDFFYSPKVPNGGVPIGNGPINNASSSTASRNNSIKKSNYTTHNLDIVDSNFKSSSSASSSYDNHLHPNHHQQQREHKHQERTISHSLSDSSGGATSSSSGGSGSSSRCSLRIGDRIVWFRENSATAARSLEFGTVRWLGFIENEDIAGIEFDRALGLGSGWYRNEHLFDCAPHHGGLVAVAGLLLEEDYLEHENQGPIVESLETSNNPANYQTDLVSFAPSSSAATKMPHVNPPYVQAPLSQDDCERISGRNKGIQGHRNSCYLDATLFSMFSFSSVFDSILIPQLVELHSNFTHSPPTATANNSSSSNELGLIVRNILREKIVNPLRKDLFTPASNVMKLREHMKHLDDKIISEEMDPQEFLQILFHQVLQLPEFLSLSLGENDYFHQCLVSSTPSDVDKKRIPTVQSLLEQSFMCQKLKFKTIPNPALILQMPRSGNKYRTYDGILPNLSIDITDLLQDTPRMCTICGGFAQYECPDCYGLFPTAAANNNTIPSGLASDSTSFCQDCIKRVHSKKDRAQHLNIAKIEFTFDPFHYFPTEIPPTAIRPSRASFTPFNYFSSSSVLPSPATPHRIPRVTMDLFAIICIETSHFVSFVKCGPGREAPWVFFDSMADRIEASYDGTGGGHNIPNVKYLPKMGVWLDKLEREPGGLFLESLENVTAELKRLITDSYICLYYSPESSMYS